MASTTQYKSIFKTAKAIKELPDGDYIVEFFKFLGSEKLDSKIVTFVSGECETDINAAPGQEVKATIVSGGFPATAAVTFTARTGPFVFANDTLTDRLSLRNKVIDQINGENYVPGRVKVLASGATFCAYNFEGANGCISYNPAGAFDHLNPDETFTEVLDYRTSEGEIGQIKIEVRGSQQVGPNLLRDYSAFSTDGWSVNGDQIAHNTGNENVISTGDLALSLDSVYEVSFLVSGVTAGSVKPVLSGVSDESSDYGMKLNGREVWYLRATSNLCKLLIEPSNDFDGSINTSSIIMKKVNSLNGVSSFREASINRVGYNEINFNLRFLEHYRWSDNNFYDYFIEDEKLGRDKEYHKTFWYDNAGVENVVINGLNLEGYHSIVARNAPTSERQGIVKGFLEAYGLSLKGGYTGSSFDNQAFFSLGVNGVACGRAALYHIDMDLLRTPNRNDHNADNTDCIRINGGCEAPVSDDFLTGFDIYAANAGDGCIDSKTTSEWNFAEYFGSNRQVRMHRSHALFMNSNFTRHEDSSGSFNIEHPYSLLQIFNSSLEGERIVSYDQVQSNLATKEGFGTGREPIYSWENYVNPSDAQHLFYVMKTLPRQRETGKAAITDLQIQAAPTGTTDWEDIYSNGIPSGHYLQVSLNAGNYDIRARIRNGNQSSEWVALGSEVRIYDLIALAFPSEFSWFTDNYAINSDSTTDFDIDDFKPAHTTDVYLSATGDDGNDGLTVGSAKATLASALSVSGVDRILASNGNYYDCAIDASTTLGGNLIIEATGDNVNLYGGNNTAAWSAEGTYTNVYQANITTVAGVLDLTDIDEWNGKVKSLLSVNSLSALDSTDTGYYHDSGTLYVKLHDGREPDSNVFTSAADSIKGHPTSTLFIERVKMFGFGVAVASSAAAGNIIAVKETDSIASAARGAFVERNGVEAYFSKYNIYNAALHGNTIANDTKCLEHDCIIDGCDGKGSIRFNSASVIRIGGKRTNSRLSQIEESGTTSSVNIGIEVTSSNLGADNCFEIGSNVDKVYVLNCKGVDTTKWETTPVILGSSGKVLEQNNTNIDVRSAVPANLF